MYIYIHIHTNTARLPNEATGTKPKTHLVTDIIAIVPELMLQCCALFYQPLPYWLNTAQSALRPKSNDTHALVLQTPPPPPSVKYYFVKQVSMVTAFFPADSLQWL